MGEMRALALPRVSREAITEALRQEIGVSWGEVVHLTATTTLARAIRSTRVPALPVATLIDLVTLPGLPGEMRLPLDTFPGPDVLAASQEDYRAKVSEWQQEAAGRRVRTGIQVDDALRRFVREHAPNRMGRALLSSRRQYATTVHSLVAAGVRPDTLVAQKPTGQLAARAWAQAEKDVPALGAPRALLWVDLDDLAEGATPEARGLLERITAAFNKAFGNETRRTIVHHGFYFYSPVQWAFFQALARVPDIDQVFIVHDDGENPAFSTWRYFFRSEWQMPVPQLVPVHHNVTPAASAFRDVLTGNGVGAMTGVEVIECRSPAELVRLWRNENESQTAPPPARFAAAAEQIERYVGRLGRQLNRSNVKGSDEAPAPTLSQLPVGSFLLALHGCITEDDDGAVSFTLTPDAALDMVASGYLDAPESCGVAPPPLFRRVLPYFSDCRSGADWIARAGQLSQMIDTRVAPLGNREEDVDDVGRIERALANPTRLVPWADISRRQLMQVQATVAAVVRLLEETTARERVVLGAHLNTIRQRLDRALRGLPPNEARVVEAKLRGVGVLTNEEIDVAGLVDVVAMILGRRLELPGTDSDSDPAQTKVKLLRGLDALGLLRADTDVHLANMAEDAFPTAAQAVGWPFTLEDLWASTDDAVEPVTAGLLGTRAQTAGLSDLYLFWLALDGVNPGGKISISWVSDSAGDRRRLSPIVSLLTVPDSTDAVKEVVGGVQINSGPSTADHEADRARPESATSDEDEDVLVQAVETVQAGAVASARACPRRFAIQWALGPTGAFGSSHLQSMLCGNVVGALEVHHEPRQRLSARAAGDDLWPHLTQGQRASSYDKRVVRPRGAHPSWVLTLKGSKNGSTDLDRAYQLGRDRRPPNALYVAPPGPATLPPRTENAEVCSVCPVQARCAEWRDPGDER